MSLRLVVIAPLRFPIRPPFAGGLESAVWNEVRLLRSRGHDVKLVATDGSDFLGDSPGSFVLPAVDWAGDGSAADDTYPPGYLETALPALGRALDAIAERADEFDVVVNHCLFGLPLERARDLGVPMVSTLHTPVIPELVEAHGLSSPGGSRFLSVSSHTARAWAGAGIDSEVLHNGIDAAAWPQGAGGPDLVWFGRLVREKAPHLALEAAHLLGRRIVIAGRIGDKDYFDAEVAPLLDDRRVHVGPLDVPALSSLVGSSGCALVTPVWDEPFGLVTPEALLCGTPVAAFAAGGIPEIATGTEGMRTVPVGDVLALATAASGLLESSADPGFRAAVRADAVERFSLRVRAEAFERILLDAASVREPA